MPASDSSKRWAFVWIMTGFAIATYIVGIFRPDVAAPAWIAPSMIAVVGVAVAEPAARRVLNGYRRKSEDDDEGT